LSASLLVIAGEASGDLHAAAVVNALRKKIEDIRVFGVGGDRLTESGAEVLVHIREMAVFGPFAAIRRYPHFRKVYRQILAEVRTRKPGAALLVDYGGFNLRIAASLQRQGVKVLYFISPQVWASRPGRIRRMAQVVDRLMVIFPFEPKVYEGTGVRVDFVGHPLKDRVEDHLAGPESNLPWTGEPRIALLPGSRKQEIERILPVLIDAAYRIGHLLPQSSFIVAAPDDEAAALIRQNLGKAVQQVERLLVVSGQTMEILRQARAALVASGTATVESALFGCPMVIVYKTSPVFFALAKRIVKVPNIGMVNLIAGREVCPELIQDAATGSAAATALFPLIESTVARNEMLQALHEVTRRLGPGGAAEKTAEVVASELSSADEGKS
jgi:lipid-A-disaccharide synthase